jgi:hypothetical protein
MNQALYAHMNNKIKKKRINMIQFSISLGSQGTVSTTHPPFSPHKVLETDQLAIPMSNHSGREFKTTLLRKLNDLKEKHRKMYQYFNRETLHRD